ncbi:MAG TPA: DUF4097 family beta strand repeat-containing protein [Longimicrobiales bacterium]|nr:DUF4097 family beta strand repeat-containing protein [Longimicrobiales bacterium]
MLMAGWMLTAAAPLPDTTLDLRRGDRVVVESPSGSVEVRAWERSTLSVEGAGGEVRDVSVRREGGRVVVRPGDRKGRGLAVALRVRVPAWAPLEIQGRELDVDVSGTASDLIVRTVDGDIRVSGVSGPVTLSTVEGLVEVRDVRGDVSARSRGGDVVLSRVNGTVEVESGDGDLRMLEITAPSVRAQTLDGDLFFQGPLAAGGTYWFSTHDGDADLVLPASTGARARVATFDGEFVSDFPVSLQRYGGGGVFEFTLGDGGATLEIQVFDGEIRLRSVGR